MPPHGFQQHLHAVDIVVEIGQRLFHALAHQRTGREVEHRVDAVFAEDPVQGLGIANVAFMKAHARGHGPAMAGQEIVDDHGFLAAGQQGAYIMRADVPGSAADQNRHASSPSLSGLRQLPRAVVK